YAWIRWFEMRQTTDGAPWYIFQEGTYSAPGGVSAFCGTMCIDAFGNIGLSYTTVSTSQFPSLRFTGRYSTDPPGVMTLAEQSFASGTQIDPATRYGDYAQMTVDPNDDATFWAIGEYFNGGRKNQVGVFKIQPLITVANFSASTTTPAIGQTVTFSDLSTLSPTSWSWSFSPGTVTFVGGTTANSQNPQVTFNAVGSYTVTLTATNSGGSDSEIKTNYISAGYCIPAYTSGAGAGDYISLVQLGSINNSTGGTPYPSYTYYSGLSTDLARVSSQTITVSAGSYFSSNYISVWIDFDHNGVFSSAENLGTVLLEAAPATGSISFTVPASAVLGTTRMRVREVYAISNPDPCSTYVYGEAEDYNVNITPIQYCTPTYSYGTNYGDFISYVQLETINNSTGAAGFPYYTYFSSMSANLTAGAEYTIALTAGTFAFNNNISVWIDYDLNGLFDEYEKLGNVVLEAAPSTGYITFTVPGNAIVGETRMRVREAYVNSNMDACSLNSFGETEDYNINILPLQYCTPEYIYGSGDGDYISLVALGSIYNASGATPFPYYTYYNSLSTNLDAGSTYTLTLSPGTYTSGNYLAAWIDYNYNGLFEDTEKLGNILVDPTPATGTITFTVPGITLSGTTRMRVREVYGDYNMSSCNLASFGETEDYPVHISNSNKILNLTVYLQGLYAGGGTMNQASSGSGPQFPGTTADQISVELHNALTYSLIEFSNPFVNLNTNGSAVVLIPSFFSGSYYVTIRHRNSIETTTATPVSFLAPSLNYAFNLQSKAYGNNLFATSDGRYLIYAGDVDQDGIVDSSDMIPADNDVSTFVTGYVVTDINGDGLVDSSDMILIDNNSGNFIGTVLP
ncbi:MAG: PKD domain-containing protein, partial [Bacteroidales bacterium]|nr:PKD domain-containing protein [Bacteroidales bacterium]